MPTIEFTYSGVINNTPIKGEAELVSNPNGGNFKAEVRFARMSSAVPLAAWGVSLVSISCSNGGKNSGALNILSTTSGEYQSVRTISVVDQKTQETCGLLRIAGKFSELLNDRIQADVQLSGSYFGPTDIDLAEFSGYSLPAIPIRDMDVPALFGVTHISLKHSSGTLLAKHEQLYLFEAGIRSGLQLQSNNMKVAFTHIDAENYPNSAVVEGISEMLGLPDRSQVSWSYRT